MKKEAIKLFEERKVRTIWDDTHEKWYFSIVDVVAILTDSPNPQTYWRVLKKRLKEEGNETVTNCNALKLKAADGKMRLTDVADTEQLFRLIQSIPSPKAEPFKQWMAEVAGTLLSPSSGVVLPLKNISSIKILKKENLRDNMTNLEMAFNILAEASTTELSKQRDPQGMEEQKKVAKEGGSVAKVARKQLEDQLGRSIISPTKAKDYLKIEESTN